MLLLFIVCSNPTLRDLDLTSEIESNEKEE